MPHTWADRHLSLFPWQSCWSSHIPSLYLRSLPPFWEEHLDQLRRLLWRVSGRLAAGSGTTLQMFTDTDRDSEWIVDTNAVHWEISFTVSAAFDFETLYWTWRNWGGIEGVMNSPNVYVYVALSSSSLTSSMVLWPPLHLWRPNWTSPLITK